MAIENIELRPNQSRAFDELKDKQLVIASMPTGWGKTVLLSALAVADALRNRKIVIVAPQRIISNNFTKERLIRLPDGQSVHWKIKHNLSESLQRSSKLQMFLYKPLSAVASERVCVTTHQTLVSAWAELGPSAFHDCTLMIDESHHVQASEIETNKLGAVVDALLKSVDPTMRLIFATAYFFRGDSLSIVPDMSLGRFHRLHVPFDEYWSSLKYVKEYAYDFVVYKGTPWQELEFALERSQVPTIIYCPPQGSPLLRGTTKDKFCARVTKLACTKLAATLWRPGVVPKANVRYVVDLIQTEHRDESIEFIAKHGDTIAAVMTVGMLKEGADWVQAARVLDLVPSGSDQDRLQRFGRLCRDSKGKRRVQYVSFFRWWQEIDEESRRKYLSAYYAHFHASLVLANAITPIKMPQRKANSGSKRRTGNSDYVDHLGQLTEKQQKEIIRASCESIIALHDIASTEKRRVSAEEVSDAVCKVLTTAGIEDDQESMAKQLILLMRRKANIKLDVQALLSAGFDKVWHDEAITAIIVYSAEVGGPSTLSEIRRVVEGIYSEEWMTVYKSLVTLPDVPPPQSPMYWWIQNNKQFFKQGKLSDERARLLERIPWWKWSETFEGRWEERCSNISAMDSMPRAGSEEYAWVRQQRRLRASLPQWKIDRLSQISWWVWDSGARDTESKIALLQRLSAMPLGRTREGELVKYFRKRYAQGKLHRKTIKMLNSIPWFNWKAQPASAPRRRKMTS